LYSAVKLRRFGRSGEVALSGAPARAASRTADAVPSRGGAVPFFLDMFNIVTGFLLALDSKFDRGSCLSHVGTEGSGHATPAMQLHYSTARGGEVKQGLAKVAKIATAGAKVIDIATARQRRRKAG
jgi:hypothetical protein